MITSEEVTWTYRVLLGRAPENPDVIALHQKWPSLEEFVRHCFEAPEFIARQPSPPYPLDSAPPIKVESLLPQAELAKMWARIQRSWQAFGDSDPYWSVLVGEHWRAGRMSDAETLNAFYATGATDVARMDAWFARNGLEARSDGVCAEYGCGVGRVTAWLARKFKTVRAFDISSSHLEAARRRLESQGVQNVEFVHVRSPDDLGALRDSDVFFSFIVLQHNPPPIIRSILEHASRGLNAGGIAFFQLPTYMAGYKFIASDYEPHQGQEPIMEMHCLPQKDVLDTLQRSRCVILEVQPDWWIGQHGRWLSHTFLAERTS